MSAIPEHFARTIREVFGDRGEAWLTRLPTLLASCEQRWSLSIHPPFELLYQEVTARMRFSATEGGGKATCCRCNCNGVLPLQYFPSVVAAVRSAPVVSGRQERRPYVLNGMIAQMC